MQAQRGFTLVELLVATVLVTIVTAALYRLLVNTQRVSRAQGERVTMQSNMRVGTLVVPAELRAIGYDSVPPGAPGAPIVPDLLAIGPTAVTFRAYRSFGVICEIATGPDRLVVSTDPVLYWALRSPVASPRDSLALFVEGDPATSLDDRWVSRAIAATPTPAACPNGTSALSFATTFAAPNDPITPAQLTIGSPIRTFEGMEYSLYESGGRYYLAARSASDPAAVREPVLGPLAANGFRLEYFAGDGTPITGTTLQARRNVRAITVALLGMSDQRVSGSGYGIQEHVVDSVVTLVQLRNAVHW